MIEACLVFSFFSGPVCTQLQIAVSAVARAIEADLGAISPGRAAADGGHGRLVEGERAFKHSCVIDSHNEPAVCPTHEPRHMRTRIPYRCEPLTRIISDSHGSQVRSRRLSSLSVPVKYKYR